MTSGGGLIRRMRESAGFSQAELARRSGVGRTVLNAYERGGREPGFTVVSRLAETCGFRVDAAPASRVDVARNGRVLLDVLDLAEKLPRRPRGELRYPPFGSV